MRGVRDGLAVAALCSLAIGCTVSAWAFAPMFGCMILAAVIDPESRAARAREHRRQRQLNAATRQRSDAAEQRAPARQLYVPIKGSPLECGCVEIPAQLVLCPADAALAEIETAWPNG